jgi:Flp pilus assembly pilin Flp
MIDKLVVKLLTLKMRLSDERGQDLVEYALLTGGIGLVLIASALVFSGVINDWFVAAGDAFADISP